MRIRVPRLNFRTKVVLFAVLLVTAIQLGTLFPVLNQARQEQQRQADARLTSAAYQYDVYMRMRTELLTLAISTMERDYPFRQNVASGDPATVESILRNHAGRANIETAAVFNLDGTRIASIGGGGSLRPWAAMERAETDPTDTSPIISIAFIEGQPFHAVTVPVELPRPIAWAMLALPIDAAFAGEIKMLTNLESTIVGFGVDSKRVYATTLDDDVRDMALADVHLGGRIDSEMPAGDAAGWITRLRPYLNEDEGVYVALQLPVENILTEFAALRNSVLQTFGIALSITIVAAVALSRMVTSPIGRLVEAAQRMAEGIYNQPMPIHSQDEFGVLARGFNSMQEAIAKRERDIVHMAHYDSLSGLPTRENIINQIRQSIGDTDRLAVVNFVLHRFDELASSLGHRTADRLIQLVAGRLLDQLENGEFLGHLNLSEFVLVLPDSNLDQARACVEELQTMLRSGIDVGNANISLQVRAGISLYPDHGVNASELLRCAGIARGHASHHLGSVGVYEQGQEERSLQLIRIVGDFPRALQNDELWIEYQPKVDCDSLGLCGAEALVRWHHPKLGRLSPDTFVEAIEQAGGISQLTRWVLEGAARTLAIWRSEGLTMSMSVNISAHDLSDDDLPAFLESLCSRHGIEASSLTLEVTESAIMHDIESSLAVISKIRSFGCRISIDDFGTGHSSLEQLKRLPVDELKIDKSFVLNIEDQRDEAVVRTAIELAHKFGLAVVAEGVENESCLVRLQQIDCDVAQGFFFSRSLPGDGFVSWARSWAAGGGADIVALVDESQRPRHLKS